jgi:hypothetical protein
MKQNSRTSYHLQISSHISLKLPFKFLNCTLGPNRVLVYLITLPQLHKLYESYGKIILKDVEGSGFDLMICFGIFVKRI